jgi:hypothetical protein
VQFSHTPCKALPMNTSKIKTEKAENDTMEMKNEKRKMKNGLPQRI